MTLEEIIKKIIEFLKGIYRSEKFAERLVNFVIAYILTSLLFLIADMDYGSIFTNIWEGLSRILTFDLFTYHGALKSDVIEFIFIIVFFPIFYFVSRTFYRVLLEKFGS